MEREQEEMQFLGVFGIFNEAYKLILSRRKIFSQITLSLILPLSVLILVQIELSGVLFHKIIHNEIDLRRTQAGTAKYNKLSDMISSEWTTFWLLKAAYAVVLLVLSLLSTAAVVYTIACVYTGRHDLDLSYKKVMSVVPKVWKRLIVTFLWTLLAIFLYHVVTFLLLIGTAVVVFFSFGHAAGRFSIIASLVVYVVGLVYLSLLWHLAGVVSVLEDARGIKAMSKSKALMKGKMWTALAVFALLTLLNMGLQILFQKLVVLGWGGFGGFERVVFGVLCLLVSVKLMLVGLVVQTIIYFVCKSYHHENIDKSALSDHLKVYLGEYVPLTAKDVQLEQFQV